MSYPRCQVTLFPYHESDHVLNIAFNILAGGKCMEHIEGFAGVSRDDIMKDEMSAVVIGIQGAQVVFTAMGGDKGLENAETDWKSRRPKREFWMKMKDTVDILSGRPRATDCCEECGRFFASTTPITKLTPSVSVNIIPPQ